MKPHSKRAVEVLAELEDIFPFPGYIRQAGLGLFQTLAEVTHRYLPTPAAILDFGAGAGDKSAFLRLLGHHCSACDDLNDPWHQEDRASERILTFAQSIGVDYLQSPSGQVPFDKNSFDLAIILDVIEHLHESPRGILCQLVERLRPRGLLLVTVPNAGNIRKRLALAVGDTNLPPYPDFFWAEGTWRGHVREYVRGDLQTLCTLMGLELVELRAADHMLQRLPRGFKRLYHWTTTLFPGWKDSWLLLARKPDGWLPPCQD